MADPEKQAEVVKAYHQRTYHRFERYADGPDTLDWDNQPDPFRYFDGCAKVELPLIIEDSSPDWDSLHANAVETQPVTLETLGALLQLAFGLSAWKQYGPSHWSLRNNPSSGNLHPTESYLIVQGYPDIDDGVYHYLPKEHVLERRYAGRAINSEAPVLCVGLSSIIWREAWKYGERAFRYVQLDTGHALASLRYSAACLGWRCEFLNLPDRKIADLLGFSREDSFEGADPEIGDALICIYPERESKRIDDICAADLDGEWFGHANALGGEPRLDWPVIREVEQASLQTGRWKNRAIETKPQALLFHNMTSTQLLIQRRRSAQGFDPHSQISLDELMPLLTALASPCSLPLDWWPTEPRIHPVLFAHRVEGLKPGLYALPRSDQGRELLCESLRTEFLWDFIETKSPGLPLHGLIYAKAENAARTLSCHQAIASDGLFAISFLAEYEAIVNTDPAEYRRLFWEAGMLGQQLYLHAEALGFQGTGIGCFFDPGVHETLGISDQRLQSLYYFTVGKAVKDGRIQTLPPYKR